MPINMKTPYLDDAGLPVKDAFGLNPNDPKRQKPAVPPIHAQTIV
jgi:hypothetical protein